jgi:tetratricopeptide (TPR) repeat protein
MEIYIAIPKNCSDDQIANVKTYTDSIIFYEKIKDLEGINNYLLLEYGDLILRWPKLQPSKYVCITNGTWIDKQSRFKIPSNNPEPIFLKNKNLKFPKFNNKLQLCYDKGDYSQFILDAEKIIFDEIKNDNIALRYFLSVVYFFKIKNSQKSEQHIRYILNKKPDFAEAWCLLGDIFVFCNMYLDAKRQYENALAYGKARDIYDDLPMCPTKYEEYPSQMIEKITQSFSNAKVLSLNNI